MRAASSNVSQIYTGLHYVESKVHRLAIDYFYPRHDKELNLNSKGLYSPIGHTTHTFYTSMRKLRPEYSGNVHSALYDDRWPNRSHDSMQVLK